MLNKQYGVIWAVFIWLKIKTIESSCEDGNEHSGSIKFWEVLE
jgi:hypothetical protein